MYAVQRGTINQLHLQQHLLPRKGFNEETLLLTAYPGFHTTSAFFFDFQ